MLFELWLMTKSFGPKLLTAVQRPPILLSMRMHADMSNTAMSWQSELGMSVMYMSASKAAIKPWAPYI